MAQIKRTVAITVGSILIGLTCAFLLTRIVNRLDLSDITTWTQIADYALVICGFVAAATTLIFTRRKREGRVRKNSLLRLRDAGISFFILFGIGFYRPIIDSEQKQLIRRFWDHTNQAKSITVASRGEKLVLEGSAKNALLGLIEQSKPYYVFTRYQMHLRHGSEIKITSGQFSEEYQLVRFGRSPSLFYLRLIDDRTENRSGGLQAINSPELNAWAQSKFPS